MGNAMPVYRSALTVVTRIPHPQRRHRSRSLPTRLIFFCYPPWRFREVLARSSRRTGRAKMLARRWTQ